MLCVVQNSAKTCRDSLTARSSGKICQLERIARNIEDLLTRASANAPNEMPPAEQHGFGRTLAAEIRKDRILTGCCPRLL
jgi:hypothetical protein